MKPVNVKPSTCFKSRNVINDEEPKFKIGDVVRISKYKNIFVKGCFPNCSEEVFVIEKVKNTLPWTYVISDPKIEEVIGMFFKKELKKWSK